MLRAAQRRRAARGRRGGGSGALLTSRICELISGKRISPRLSANCPDSIALMVPETHAVSRSTKNSWFSALIILTMSAPELLLAAASSSAMLCRPSPPFRTSTPFCHEHTEVPKRQRMGRRRRRRNLISFFS